MATLTSDFARSYRRRTRLVFMVLGTLIVAACSTTPGASSPSATGAASTKPVSAASLDAACAASEGELNYYSGVDEAAFAKELALFNQKYPNVKVNFTSMQPEQINQRITAEFQANRTTDVDAFTSFIQVVYPFTQAGMAVDVDWSSVGIPSDFVQTVNGVRVWRLYRTVLGLGYNTTTIDPSQLPTTWDGLVDAKYGPSKIVVDPRGVYLSELSYSWGKAKTVDWMSKLMATDKPLVLQGATASMQKVISGEVAMTTSSHNNDIAQQQANGAPVGIKYLDLAPTNDTLEVVVKGAPHPNAALCFLGWLGGADGQAAELKYEFRNAQTPKDIPSTATIAGANSADDASVAADTAKALAAVVTGQ